MIHNEISPSISRIEGLISRSGLRTIHGPWYHHPVTTAGKQPETKKTPTKTTSPWRYPGGKNRLSAAIVPHLADIIDYCEPFVGGGSMALAMCGKPSVTSVLLNDGDLRVGAWWAVLADPDPTDFEILMGMLTSYVPTVDNFRKFQKDATEVRMERAFAGMVTNRCAYSGIMSGGPIGGTAQVSDYTVGCRYNPMRLIVQHRAVRAALLSKQATVMVGDFRDCIESTSPDTFLYLDPPYVQVGKDLYPKSLDDHEDLAVLLDERGSWLLSYDDHEWVRDRYAKHIIEPVEVYYSISPKPTIGAKRTELLIRPHSTKLL